MKKLAPGLIALAVSLPGTSSAFAHGTTMPIHQVGSVECRGGGNINAAPPRSMASWYANVNYRNAEQVEWSPNLYRWNRRQQRWRLYDSSAPWYYAFTTRGFGFYQAPYDQAWHWPSGQGMYYVAWRGVRGGHYYIRNYMHWNAVGRTHSQWGGGCRFY